MHPAQRRALLAMITSIEQQLAGVRGLLFDVSSPLTSAPGAPAPKPTTEYLSREEEDKFEAQLEAERLLLAEEEEAKAQALWQSQQ